MAGIKIISTGSYVPPKVVTNDDLSKIMDTSDEWITTRCGIKERHYCEDETNLDIAYNAATAALEKSDITKEQISLVIVATVSADNPSPSLACRLSERLELPTSVIAFDISAACSGFVYALTVANDMLKSRPGTYALVLGSERLSQFLPNSDRGTAILFADGAGCAVCTYSEDGVFDSILGTERDEHVLYVDGDNKSIYMEGKKVFTYAVKRMTSNAKLMMEKRNITLDDIDYVVCHQANERIIESVIKHLGGTDHHEKFYMNLQKYGNTSAACIPLVLDELAQNGKLKPGTKILMVIFGAGFTYGAAYIEI